MRQLFELCGEDRDICFSPYVWRTRMMLLHKGLEFERVPLWFLEKEPLAPANSKTVPVLNDNGTWVMDSFKIARYLDETYPEKPLFGSETALNQAAVLNTWTTKNILMPIFPMLVADIHAVLDAENAAYFRKSREGFLGKTLEEAQSPRDEMLPKFGKSLQDLRTILQETPYLSGQAPAWFDYAVFGTLMWPRVISNFEILAEDDVLYAWREKMLDLFDGHARKAKLAY